MSKVFIVDIAKCTGCYNCQLVNLLLTSMILLFGFAVGYC